MKPITKPIIMYAPTTLVNKILIFSTSFFLFPECSADIPLDPSMVTVTDTYNATSMGADKAILTDLKDYSSAWCTNNTSGTSKIMVSDSNVYFVTTLILSQLRSVSP